MPAFKRHAPGTRALISMGSAIKYAPARLQDMDGRLFEVKKFVPVRQPKMNGKTASLGYYELFDCESEKGIPYSFDEDWLMPVRELHK